jgi:hypothetical protein
LRSGKGESPWKAAAQEAVPVHVNLRVQLASRQVISSYESDSHVVGTGLHDAAGGELPLEHATKRAIAKPIPRIRIRMLESSP